MKYTPAQVAETFKIATSTLRKYSVLFEAYLSPSAHRKQRTYTDEDISIIKRIVDFRDDGISLAEIDQQLKVGVVGGLQPITLAMIPQITAKLDDLYHTIASQTQQLEELQARLDTLESRSLWQRIFPPKRKQE